MAEAIKLRFDFRADALERRVALSCSFPRRIRQASQTIALGRRTVAARPPVLSLLSTALCCLDRAFGFRPTPIALVVADDSNRALRPLIDDSA